MIRLKKDYLNINMFVINYKIDIIDQCNKIILLYN